ncbi:MAG: hypothetical protein ACMUIE_05610 [Thermoplasmatota archaeon]
MMELTPNESHVMLSLITNPEHSDTELSEAVGMNPFTFNKVKNSILKRGLLRRELVPNYGRVGFELLVVSFGGRIETFLDPVSRMEMLQKLEGEIPTHFFFRLMEATQGLGLHALEDFTLFKKGLVLKRKIASFMGDNLSSIEHVAFSFRDIRMEKFFDLGDLLSDIYGNGMEVPKLEPTSPAQKAASISWFDFFNYDRKGNGSDIDDREMDIMKVLVSRPMLSDPELCELLSMSRYKLRKARDSFYERGLLKPLLIPDPRVLGLDVIIFTHAMFKPECQPMELLHQYSEHFPPNLILVVSDFQEAVALGVYRTLSEGVNAQKRMIEELSAQNVLEKEPVSHIFSLPNCRGDWPLTLQGPLMNKGDWALSPQVMEWLVKISPRGPGSRRRSPRSS